jgi:putative ABC transport system permease protein
MNTLRLSLNMLRRDWRAGEWRVLFAALVLAVGSISTVELFASRVQLLLQQESHALLGADLRITSTRPLPPAYRAEAQQRGLRVLRTSSFPSMVSRARQDVLTEILAVEPGYPLRGKITIDDGITHVAQSIPARGTLWADERLMLRMGLHLGDKVRLGGLHLRVAAEVVRDVNQSFGFASFAPHAIINAADLLASGLVQPGSRIRYSLLFAGAEKQVSGMRAWLKTRLELGERLEDVRDARPEIRVALERSEHFFGLAALTAVVLAGVAMGLASRRFIMRHLDSCAVMRCLGAGQAQVLSIFFYQFLLLGVVATLLGDGVGYAVQAALVQSLASMRAAHLPPPSGLPLLQAAASGMALLLGFAFLPLWQLKSVSPLRVLRRELGLPQMRTGLLYLSGGAVLCGLFLWQAGSLKLGLTVLGGLAGGLLVFGLLAWVVLRALAVLPVRQRHVFANLARHGRGNALQIVALSLGGMALLVLTLVRADMLQNWRERMPPDMPNRFIVNVQPDQRASVLAFFTQHGLAQPELHPMVRGRLVALNGHPVNGNSYSDPRARRLAEREFNLSWAQNLPIGNQVVAGAWWRRRGGGEAAGSPSASHLRGQEIPPQFSVEQGIAQTLGIHLGDTLTYDVAGSRFTARVTSLRKLDWDRMNVNFFVIAAPGMLEQYPASYLTSFHLSPDRKEFGVELIRKFPNLLLIDTDAIIAQVRHIMDEISQTLSVLFLFTLFSGLAVLYAVLLSTRDERSQHAAILRTLGAGSGYLRRLYLTEFAVLGALSGLFAAAGAALLGWELSHRVLDIPYTPTALLWLVGAGGGILLVMLSGWLVTRRVAQVPPLQVLQSAV